MPQYTQVVDDKYSTSLQIAAAPGYAAMVESKQGVHRLLQWHAGGSTFHPVPALTFNNPSGFNMAMVAGSTFEHTVFLHTDKDKTVRTWVRGRDNRWTKLDDTKLDGPDSATLTSLVVLDGGRAVASFQLGRNAAASDGVLDLGV